VCRNQKVVEFLKGLFWIPNPREHLMDRPSLGEAAMIVAVSRIK